MIILKNENERMRGVTQSESVPSRMPNHPMEAKADGLGKVPTKDKPADQVYWFTEVCESFRS